MFEQEFAHVERDGEVSFYEITRFFVFSKVLIIDMLQFNVHLSLGFSI